MSRRRKELDKQREAKKAAMSAPGYKSTYAQKRRASYVPKLECKRKDRHGEEFRVNPTPFIRTNKDAFGGWA